jgi:hypothetical protein
MDPVGAKNRDPENRMRKADGPGNRKDRGRRAIGNNLPEAARVARDHAYSPSHPPPVSLPNKSGKAARARLTSIFRSAS